MFCSVRDYEHRGDAEWLNEPCEQDETEFVPGGTAREAFKAALDCTHHIRLLEQLARLLQKCPALFLKLKDQTIRIGGTNPNGCPISVMTLRNRYVVRFGDWSAQFALMKDVVDLLQAALEGEVRLLVYIKDNGSHWVAERRLQTGHWTKIHDVDSLTIWPSGEPTHTIVLRNYATHS